MFCIGSVAIIWFGTRKVDFCRKVSFCRKGVAVKARKGIDRNARRPFLTDREKSEHFINRKVW